MTAVRKIKIISGMTEAKTHIITHELVTGALDTASLVLPRSPNGVCVMEWLYEGLEVMEDEYATTGSAVTCDRFGVTLVSCGVGLIEPPDRAGIQDIPLADNVKFGLHEHL